MARGDGALKSQLSSVQVTTRRASGAISFAAGLALCVGRRADIGECPDRNAAAFNYLLSSRLTRGDRLEHWRRHTDGSVGNRGADGTAICANKHYGCGST